MNPRVRFAPSPTGQVHIGNIRTAIFNWLFARNQNGSFLLRVEDTDRERSTPEAIEKLMECMSWIGLDYDEEVLYQSDQAEKHLAAAERMVESGTAYRPKADSPLTLFRIPMYDENNPITRVAGPVELKVHPEANVSISLDRISYAQVSKKGKQIPEEAALAGFHKLQIFDLDGNKIFDIEESLEDLKNNAASVELTGCAIFRFQRLEVFFEDMIKGKLAKPLDTMKNLVIVRSDGSPVFHLANVVDDIAQNITHVVRGDDHVENTYRHLFLYQALEAEFPKYAHLPMIVNQAGKPYSKRDGDAFVGDFKSKGFLAEALFNYLTLLGWSPGDDREKMTKEELISAFALERVLSSPGKFDQNKLMNLNGQYLAELDPAKFADLAWEEAKKLPWAADTDSAKFAAVAALMQSRTKLMPQVADWDCFFSDDIEYDPKGVRKFLSRDEVKSALTTLLESLSSLDDWSEAPIEREIRAAESSAGLNEGKLNQSLRVAVTGKTIGAGVYETMILLGKETVLKRLGGDWSPTE